MNRSYRVALFCGAFPLLVGVSIFVLWLVTRWNWLMVAGIGTLYGGVAIVLVGVVALVRFYWLATRAPGLPSRQLWRSTVACSGLLLVNFPVALGITVASVAIATRYTVVIHNGSQQPLTNARVFGGGFDHTWSSIPPGGTVQESFWVEGDDTLEFRAVSGTAVHAETIDDYVTSSMGGHTTVTINPDGTVSVSNSRL